MHNNMKAAVLATKVLDVYQKLWNKQFKAEDFDAKSSFKQELLRAAIPESAKKSIAFDDFNFVLTRANAHKILDYHQSRYVRLDDQDALLMKIWAEIIMDVFGERVEVSMENKAQLDGNLVNNMFPILDNTLKVIAGLDLNNQQLSALDDMMEKYNYRSVKNYEENIQELKDAARHAQETLKKANAAHDADQKKIAELDTQVKKYSKIFNKLKAAI